MHVTLRYIVRWRTAYIGSLSTSTPPLCFQLINRRGPYWDLDRSRCAHHKACIVALDALHPSCSPTTIISWRGNIPGMLPISRIDTYLFSLALDSYDQRLQVTPLLHCLPPSTCGTTATQVSFFPFVFSFVQSSIYAPLPFCSSRTRLQEI